MLSSWATSSIEEVAEAAPAGLRWLQLYMFKDREVRESLVRRAERAGFRGIFVTVDTPYLGRRIADVRNKFQLPPHLRYICCWVWGGTVPGPRAAGGEVCPGQQLRGAVRVSRAVLGLGSALGQNEALLAVCML